jgi:hypothetical protein
MYILSTQGSDGQEDGENDDMEEPKNGADGDQDEAEEKWRRS